MNNFFLAINGLFLFTVSAMLVRIFCAHALKWGLLDIPNARSSHQEVVPRGGGVVFVLLWILCVFIGFEFKWIAFRELLLLASSTFLISLLGFWDDYRGLTAKKRLIGQIFIAMLSITQLGEISELHLFSYATFHLGWVGIGLAILALVWSTNAFNFMDGLDGFAALEALFVFGFGGLFLWNAGGAPFAWLSWALALLVAGFLVWNWPKARVFMGDAGSYCLGFLVPLFALVGDKHYQIPIMLWGILYGVFWFDATITLLRRFWKGENLTMPHREHAYQRLFRAGFSPVQILVGMSVLNSVLASIALFVSFRTDFLGWGLLLAIALLSSVYVIIEKIKPMARVVA